MEPISFVLDTFIQLAERIINLEKTKRGDKQQVFKEIIEPLFVQLQPVAENYILIFRKAKQDVIENPGNDLSKALDEIRESREKMELARNTVEAMAEQIHNMYKDEKIIDFAESILIFFDISLYGQKTGPTRSRQLIEMFERVLVNPEQKIVLDKFIFAALLNIEQHWKKIGQSYAAAKIYCLSAPQLIKKSK